MTRSVNPYDRAKRVLDVGAASIAFVVLLPVQAVVAVMVLTKLGRPVIFRQDRPGRDGVVFVLRKFRTMKKAELATVSGFAGDEARLSRFGRILRSTSLDELPSLLNVIKGDMSIVGPRPLLVSYLDRYSDEQARRHEVRPGVTGLAQVSGRNALTWREKFELDVEYVKRRSLVLDSQILIRTVTTVVKRDGVSEPGKATASEFLGDVDEPAPQKLRTPPTLENGHNDG